MYTLVELAVSVGVLLTLVTILSACVCGCKNSNQKSELVGTAGVVKIRFDEEAPSPSSTTPASVKRASTQNSQRSLPEIPHTVGRHDSGDTASDIYATVNIDEGTKVIPTTSNNRDHPYEHAYAKPVIENHVTVDLSPALRPDDEIAIDERDSTHQPAEAVVISASVAISGQLPSSQELPYITPPSPRHHPQHFSGDSTDSTKGYTSISVREPLSNIRALQNSKVQPHYATVSDDSDEMYAAIEEPLAGGVASNAHVADMYAQIETRARDRRSLEREVVPARTSLLPTDANARRSAPPEMGTATNSTHSRQASSSSCSNSGGGLGSPKPEKRQANSPLPPTPHPPAQPPHANERGRSPLGQTFAQRQQRISSTGDLHFSHDKMRRSLNEKHQRNNSCVSSSDFYGCNYPVEKHRFSSGDLMRPLVAKELTFDIDQQEPADNLYNSIEPANERTNANITNTSDTKSSESPSRNIEEMYAKVMKKKSKLSLDDKTKDGQEGLKVRPDDPGYETIDRKAGHGYETITRKERKVSQDPGYETVKDVNRPNTNYANNNLLGKLNLATDSGPNSIISSDPGYEHISKDNSASDSDPNYEVLRNQPPTPPYAVIAPLKSQPTYSVVNKRANWSNNNEEAITEPNYESMPNDPLYTTGSESDPNYESVRPKGLFSYRAKDPNYESLRHKDPNYESLRRSDPKYESVRSKDSKDPNYESVKYFELTKKEPPYERLHNEAPDGAGLDRSDSTGGYEKINVPNNENKGSINSGENATVSDYFNV